MNFRRIVASKQRLRRSPKREGLRAFPKLVDQFENGLRSSVAAARTDLGQASVATVSLFVAGTDVVEKVLHQVFAVQQAHADQDLGLFHVALAKQRLGGLGA